MADVAARAGVSLKTVSRVVNAEPHVSPDVSERVRASIVELGYRPDRRARDLAATSPSRLLGFVQVDAANRFFAEVYRGLEDVTRDAGYLIIAGSTDAEPAREAALVETLIESRVDGLVVAGAEGSDDLLRREIAHGTPVVCVDRILAGVNCDTVVGGNREATREAVGHLIAVGHRRIAYLGGDPRVWTAAERLAGYGEALAASGVPRTADLEVLDVGDVTRAAEATRRLLASSAAPTALFTAQDRITIGAVTALHALGREREVALFGFDEIPFSQQLKPSVSVVAQAPAEMGRRAGHLLLERLTGPSTTDGRRVVVEATLHHRESGSLSPRPAPIG